jgi:hypothetical protein
MTVLIPKKATVLPHPTLKAARQLIFLRRRLCRQLISLLRLLATFHFLIRCSWNIRGIVGVELERHLNS